MPHGESEDQRLGALCLSIETREDLVVFVRALSRNLNTDEEYWENPTLDRYLEAMSAWIAASPGYFKN